MEKYPSFIGSQLINEGYFFGLSHRLKHKAAGEHKNGD